MFRDFIWNGYTILINLVGFTVLRYRIPEQNNISILIMNFDHQVFSNAKKELQDEGLDSSQLVATPEC